MSTEKNSKTKRPMHRKKQILEPSFSCADSPLLHPKRETDVADFLSVVSLMMKNNWIAHHETRFFDPSTLFFVTDLSTCNDRFYLNLSFSVFFFYMDMRLSAWVQSVGGLLPRMKIPSIRVCVDFIFQNIDSLPYTNPTHSNKKKINESKKAKKLIRKCHLSVVLSVICLHHCSWCHYHLDVSMISIYHMAYTRFESRKFVSKQSNSEGTYQVKPICSTSSTVWGNGWFIVSGQIVAKTTAISEVKPKKMIGKWTHARAWNNSLLHRSTRNQRQHTRRSFDNVPIIAPMRAIMAQIPMSEFRAWVGNNSFA